MVGKEECRTRIALYCPPVTNKVKQKHYLEVDARLLTSTQTAAGFIRASALLRKVQRQHECTYTDEMS